MNTERTKYLMKIEIEKAYILIDKYHRGQANQEEILSLNAWKYSSSHNEIVFEEVIYLLDMIGGLKDWKQFDKNKAWNIFQKSVSLRKLRVSWQKIAGIAAIFVFVFAATFWKIGLFETNPTSKILLGIDQQFSIFDDGSEFVLASNAVIDVNDFSVTNRVLRTEGDYFVHVKTNPAKPFEIQTKNFKILVLGTSFEVDEDGSKSIVRVRDGKVRITTNNGTSHLVTGNEKFEYTGQEVRISKLDDYDWGLFQKSYKDESVFNLLNDLANKYPYFKFSSESISPECRITTKIEQASVVEILEELSLIFKVSYNIEKGKIVVNQISC